MSKIKLALVQMKGFSDKDKTIEKMKKKVAEAAATGADIIVLPEMWNCPYGTKFFRDYGEYENDSRSIKELSALAKEFGVYLFGGTISELDVDKVYNTCYVFDRQGEIIGKHRKHHLFDVDIKGKMRFKESDVLSPGENLTVVDTEFGKIGVAVCYDVRFAGDFNKMTKEMGALAFIVPAAFNTTTGPRFWQIIMQGRAVDNQSFIIACAPALDDNAPYDAYGHSCVVSPWGEIIKMAEYEETIVTAEIDLSEVMEARTQIPILNPTSL